MGKLNHIAHDDVNLPTPLPPPFVDARLADFTAEQRSGASSPSRAARAMMPITFAHPPARLKPAQAPAPIRVSGRIVQALDLARDVVEVTITPDAPIELLPGQYCHFSFAGLPFRPFSPTAALGTIREDGYIRLHIKRVRGGCVTPHVGKTIKAGHLVEMIGPYGRPFVRPASNKRLVLIGGGTGFAPIWAIATTAIREVPSRPIVLAGSSLTLDAFYMAPALELARGYPNVSIVASVDEIAAPWHGFVPGPLIKHLPRLSDRDVVYVAGRHALVGAVGKAAAMVGATFHADPLEPALPSQEGWIESARRWLSTR